MADEHVRERCRALRERLIMEYERDHETTAWTHGMRHAVGHWIHAINWAVERVERHYQQLRAQNEELVEENQRLRGQLAAPKAPENACDHQWDGGFVHAHSGGETYQRRCVHCDLVQQAHLTPAEIREGRPLQWAPDTPPDMIRTIRLTDNAYGGEVRDVLPYEGEGAVGYVTDGTWYGIRYEDGSVDWLATDLARAFGEDVEIVEDPLTS